MALEWMLKTLVGLGFEQHEAEVYLFLALNGAQEVSAIAEALGTYRQHVYRTLRKLQNLQLVSRTQRFHRRFTALPFNKTLDLLTRDSLQKARRIEQNKDSILALWNSCVKKGNKF